LVVGHRVHDDRGAADAVALVADFLVVHAFEVARGLVDVALDRVGGHVGRLGLVHREAKPRVRRQVTAALPRGDHDLADHARPHLPALFVLATLAMLDVRPFAVSGHESFSSILLSKTDSTFQAMADPLLVAKNAQTECNLLPGLANRHGLITGATGTGKT